MRFINKYPIYVIYHKCSFVEVFPLPFLITKVWYMCLAEGFVIMECKACEKSYWGWDVLADRPISWRHGVSIQSISALNFTNQQLFYVSMHVPPRNEEFQPVIPQLCNPCCRQLVFGQLSGLLEPPHDIDISIHLQIHYHILMMYIYMCNFLMQRHAPLHCIALPEHEISSQFIISD